MFYVREEKKGVFWFSKSIVDFFKADLILQSGGDWSRFFNRKDNSEVTEV